MKETTLGCTTAILHAPTQTHFIGVSLGTDNEFIAAKRAKPVLRLLRTYFKQEREKLNAAKKGIKQQNGKRKHQKGNGCGEATKASRSHRAKSSGEVKQI
jgi:hypothetical protein